MTRPGAKIPVATASEIAPIDTAAHARRPFAHLRRELDRVLDDVAIGLMRSPFHRPEFEPFWVPESWITTPAVDLVERDDAFELRAELPGLDETNVEVEIANGVLTIKGERQADEDEETEDFQVRERRFGWVERAIGIPETADPDKIEARLKNGVLRITLPKAAEAQSRTR